jgi:lysophospholipase L1-like esterase
MKVLVLAFRAAIFSSSLIFGGLEVRSIAAETRKAEPTTIGIDHAHLLLAPYVWKRSGSGPAARAEAAMPGAYLKARFQASSSIELIVDGTANRGCPASSMPVVEYSIDEAAFHVVPLTRTGQVYRLPIAAGLAAERPHRIELYFRAADLTKNRWSASTTHLRIAGLALDVGGSLLRYPARPRNAIGFGDSITEGVGADGLFTSWQSLDVNNARDTWLPIVCSALNCEYGQLGSGGQGMTRTIHLPPLPETWDRYDPTTSRLTNGKLLPEPDYAFCGMGTNDFDKDITADYTRWLTAMRKACPHTRFFCLVPPLGVHQTEVAAAVAARNQAGDAHVYLIDIRPLQVAFRSGHGATQLAFDGVHPSGYGHALLGARIAVEVQKILCETK